jgi:hypothetical protein
MLGGPHYFTAAHCKRHIQRDLDLVTKRACESGEVRKLFIDYLIERKYGRSFTELELFAKRAELGKNLLQALREDVDEGE